MLQVGPGDSEPGIFLFDPQTPLESTRCEAHEKVNKTHRKQAIKKQWNYAANAHKKLYVITDILGS